jgi:hypothetical protein
MSEWQPIETAPKDGTRILALIRQSDYIKILHWEPDSSYERTKYPEYHQWFDGYTHWIPSHWMPLPSPPLRNRENEK